MHISHCTDCNAEGQNIYIISEICLRQKKRRMRRLERLIYIIYVTSIIEKTDIYNVAYRVLSRRVVMFKDLASCAREKGSRGVSDQVTKTKEAGRCLLAVYTTQYILYIYTIQRAE